MTVAPAGDASIGRVYHMMAWPSGGVLVAGAKGWFLARVAGGDVTVDAAGEVDTGPVLAVHDFRPGTKLIRARPELFVARDDGRQGDHQAC